MNLPTSQLSCIAKNAEVGTESEWNCSTQGILRYCVQIQSWMMTSYSMHLLTKSVFHDVGEAKKTVGRKGQCSVLVKCGALQGCYSPCLAGWFDCIVWSSKLAEDCVLAKEKRRWKDPIARYVEKGKDFWQVRKKGNRGKRPGSSSLCCSGVSQCNANLMDGVNLFSRGN